MKRRPNKRRHRRNPHAKPLAATITDRLGPGALTMPTTTNKLPQSPRMPSPPRSAREVLNLLLATTGLALAARPNAEVELLPGTPTTVIITNNGKAEAAFVLPVDPGDVLQAMGRDAPRPRPRNLEQLWEEERQAASPTPETLLVQAVEAGR